MFLPRNYPVRERVQEPWGHPLNHKVGKNLMGHLVQASTQVWAVLFLYDPRHKPLLNISSEGDSLNQKSQEQCGEKLTRKLV